MLQSLSRSRLLYVIPVLALIASAVLLFFGIAAIQVPPSPPANSGTASVVLTDTEQQWIAAHPTVVVCPDPDYPPFEFYDDTGSYAGISADYLNLAGRKTGLSITPVRQQDWNSCIRMIREQKADLLGAVFISDYRHEYLNYTDPYYQYPLVIITRDSVPSGLTLNDLSGMKVAAIEGYTASEILKEQYPGIKIQPVPDIKTALRSVSLGVSDAYLGDLTTTSWYVEKEGLTNLHVAGEYVPPDSGEFHLAIGVRNDEPELRGILNKGLSAITPEEREKIVNRWVSSSLTRPTVDPWILTALAIGISVLLFAIIVIVILNRMLEHAVSDKTSELHRELEEKKKAEALLRESEAKYRTIIDTIQDVYYRADNKGNLLMISPSGAKLLGYDSPAEMIGLDIAGQLYASPKDRNDLLSALTATGVIQDYEVDLKRKDGTVVTVSTNSHRVASPDGTPGGTEGIFRDVTQRNRIADEMRKKNRELHTAYEHLTVTEEELKRNYDDLERSQKALEQARSKLNLLTTVALQDIQNAIFSLSGYFELEKQIGMDPTLRQYIEKQTRIVQTIAESLQFIKNYQNLGLMPPRWQNVQQSFLMAISHRDFSKYSRDIQVKGLEIYADALLEQVFFALAENVLVHARTATEIRLVCHETETGLVIVFADNGVGIPEERKASIFDKQNSGHGCMGLFLAREILSVTGIAIRECGKPGSGARFEISVPKNAYRFGPEEKTSGSP